MIKKLLLVLLILFISIYTYLKLDYSNKGISKIVEKFLIVDKGKEYILSKDLKKISFDNKIYKKINDKEYKCNKEKIIFERPVYEKINKVYFNNIDKKSNIYIPKIIWQTFRFNIEKDNPLFKRVEKIRNQKGYEYRFMNDNEGLKFLKENFKEDVWKCFSILIPGAYKGDLLKACIIYIYGGIYIDMKVDLIYPLDYILEDKKLVLTKDTSDVRVWNGFFAATPKHPYLKNIIEKIVYKVKNKNYGINNTDVTGPQLWGFEYVKYFKTLRFFKKNKDFIMLKLIVFKDKIIISNNYYEPLLEYKKDYHTYYGKKHKHYVDLWKEKKVFDLDLYRQYFLTRD